MGGLTLDELQKIGAKPVGNRSGGLTLEELSRMRSSTQPEAERNLGAEFSSGFVKSNLRFLQNLGKGALETITLGKANTEKMGISDELLKPRTGTEKFGEVIGDITQFAIPGSTVTKATKGAGLFTRLLSRALTSGSIATAQEGEVGSGTAIATGAELAFPAVGKALTVGKNIASRITKALSSGLSGVPSQTIEAIFESPRVAKGIAQEVDLAGSSKVLRRNAETILNGVSEIRREASKAFGEGLEQLSQTDIDSTVFRSNVQGVLDKYGVSGGKDLRILKDVEFDDPKNMKRASNLVSRLANVELNGKSLRKLADDIDATKFKTATSDERIAFNRFLGDLSNSLTNAVSKSTSKLDEINKIYSQDIQLAEAIQGIFGKVKFKSSNELRKVSEKLESLFSKKGLSPDYIDDFLNRIGVSPEGFRASEATRQISGQTFQANSIGTSPFEIIRGITGSIVSPKAVRNVAIQVGIAEDALAPVLSKLPIMARAAVLDLLLETNNQQ